MYRLVADLFRQPDGEKPGLGVECNLAVGNKEENIDNLLRIKKVFRNSCSLQYLRSTKMTRGLGHLSYGERLRSWGC